MKQEKVVWITGAASGFGLLTAASFLQAGWTVVATMRQADSRQEGVTNSVLERAEGAAVSRLHIWELDVTSEQAVTETAERIKLTFGRLDILVNNAGFAVGGFAEDIPMEQWRKQFDTNVFAVIQTSREAMRIMREQKEGCIIQLSSISGRMGFPGMGPYAASKFAVEGFSESLRYEALVHGVDVVLVEAGSYKTNIWDRSLSMLDEQPNSPNAIYTSKLKASVAETSRTASPPEQVSRLILRIAALPHGRRRLRYIVGKGVRQSLAARAMLPWRVFERIVWRIIGVKLPHKREQH
ncbi:SDR family oxidoreductase [Paenibacillus marinisediminis]